MPELPEVETIARKIRPELVGKTITDANLLWSRTLATPSEKQFKRGVKGQGITDVGRRAKFLRLELSNAFLFIHLRMSGDIYLKSASAPLEKHDRLILSLTDDTLFVFNDTRKFGRVWLVTDPNEVVGGLGPEPLGDEFTPAWLFDALRSRKRQLKPLLLDQSFLAGMGNIYTDEALHMARLHPLTRSNAVKQEQVQHLYDAIRAVLKEGIRRNGASIDWVYRGGEFQNYFSVYGRGGQPCLVCGTPVERLVVGQRSTHFCPICQRI
jgi:formamidopyrimidine-DNA glycosylase